MRNPDLAGTLDAIANPMQVIAGLTTELGRSALVAAQQLVELEGAVDGVVRLLRDRQPKSTGDA